MPSRKIATWIPNQHGAWSMVVSSWLTGLIVGWFGWRQLLILPAWLLGYSAYFMFGQLLRSPANRRGRWWPPVLVYGLSSMAIVLVLVASWPKLLYFFGLPIAVLMGVSLWCSFKRMDRSWLNDAVTTGAVALTAVITAEGGTYRIHEDIYWLAGAMLFAYFLGTVFFMKTMIREKGNTRVYWASVGYHGAVALAAWLFVGWVPCLLAITLLVRAAYVPGRWPDASPQRLGVIEIGMSTLVVLVTILRVKNIV